MITGIEHIAIYANDTKALADWYVRVLGFRIVYDNGKGTYFVAAADGGMIEVCATDDSMRKAMPTESGIRHIALATDHLAEMTEKLMDAGVEVVTPMKMSDSGIGTFFFRDPAGNILHLIQRPVPLV